MDSFTLLVIQKNHISQIYIWRRFMTRKNISCQHYVDGISAWLVMRLLKVVTITIFC